MMTMLSFQADHRSMAKKTEERFDEQQRLNAENDRNWIDQRRINSNAAQRMERIEQA